MSIVPGDHNFGAVLIPWVMGKADTNAIFAGLGIVLLGDLWERDQSLEVAKEVS